MKAEKYHTIPTRKELQELETGVYLVVTVNADTGAWRWVDRFTSKAEALNWIKFA